MNISDAPSAYIRHSEALDRPYEISNTEGRLAEGLGFLMVPGKPRAIK